MYQLRYAKLKALLLGLSFLLIMLSCQPEDFKDVLINLELDKDTYVINDDIELSILIYPKAEEDEIRFNKNFNNLSLDFISAKGQSNFSQISHKPSVLQASLLASHSLVKTYKITKKKPFEKIFRGIISSNQNKIIISIPEIALNKEIKKSTLLQNSTLYIKGYCRQVYGTEKVYFESKKFKILVKE